MFSKNDCWNIDNLNTSKLNQESRRAQWKSLVNFFLKLRDNDRKENTFPVHTLIEIIEREKKYCDKRARILKSAAVT